jgi:N utilization substance protein A
MSRIIELVDTIHLDRRIDKELIFTSIEAGIVTAVRKQYGEDVEIAVEIDRKTGRITGKRDGEAISEEIVERIGAQSAKQVIIQKIREAECNSLYDEYYPKIGQLLSGEVVKNERGNTIISLPHTGATTRGEKEKIEAILLRAEKISGEDFRIKTMVRALIVDVKKDPSRVKVIVSRTRPLFVQRLFEQEIPDIADGVVEIKGVAREAGHRTKIAVHSTDARVDPVGACIGVRGSRIKHITEEINERIDVIPWDNDLQVFIPNTLKPAEVEEVILCAMLGRAYVLVKPEQRSLAIGRRGQNIRLASKLCGWDVDIMTRDELEAMLEKAVVKYTAINGVTPELADRLVGEGFLTYEDLSVIEPIDLMQMGELTEEQQIRISEQADELAEKEAIEGTGRVINSPRDEDENSGG